jgi:fatty-acyl-CoA synthase
MMRELRDDFDVEARHAWGMTEMSPLGTVSTLKHKHESASAADRDTVLAKQGRVVYGVDIKIVDERGAELPWDGTVFGDLLVRGPWISSDYFKSEEPSPLIDGWFPTGDVATIDPDGYIKITDRSKDVIKSGGEWISSIDLENIAMAHPAVQEAAVIGVKHPQWGERPLLVVVPKPGVTSTPEELLCSYDGKTAKWCRPDSVVFVDELPHTATGKLHKVRLREQLADFAWPE